MTNDVRSFWVGSAMFTVGALVGAGVGLLFAPQSGVRTRRRLHSLVTDTGERAGELVEEAKLSMKQAVKEARKLAEQGLDGRRVVGRHS